MNVIAIVGPTAIGKSALAVELALALDAEVVSADSMQVYIGMDVGTAKPTLAERRGIAHHMIDVWQPSDEVSVVTFRDRARASLLDILERGKPAVVVGGSWLYVQAILDDLEFPGTDPEVRARLEEELVALGPAVLHERLAERDPAAAAAILPTNGRRIVRALEVIEISGSFTARLPEPRPWVQAAWIGLALDRVALDARITERVEAMWAAGLVEEVRRVSAAGMGRTAREALGYRQVLEALESGADPKGAVRETIDGTRRFARRQERRFRQDSRTAWVPAGPRALDDALALLGR
ncbi:MAG: tRNA (adenosine(37)-N6)-dimethylallyltransferase MiaA [Candidatus Nanopelagicales bacterium]